MQLPIYDINGKEEGKLDLPNIFNEGFKEYLVNRALIAELTSKLQKQGRYRLAGLETTAVYVGRRGAYRAGRDRGWARLPRVKLGGGALGDVRRVPSSKKGRRAHPTKVEKKIKEEINIKEYRKAIKSAISGLLINNDRAYPVIVDDKIEEIEKSKEFISVLKNLNLYNIVEDAKEPRIRKGLSRKSRKRIFKKALILFISNKEKPLYKAARNIAGLEICTLDELRVNKIAPGNKPRPSLWNKSAIEHIEDAINKVEKP